MATSLEIGDGELDLNKTHLPTGWVTFEEVIRFLIFDLVWSRPAAMGGPIF
jgi:hypothetical protein